ncbi:MAG: transposase [Candidatus Nitronauta litoralis]|uniref:Transposase n=1 Tax=Candidatus Nitronauta litoralis TaxID=2705533 RepID=A0A7T0BVF4_9BACT|nr:MAG: transposase [Candidatus Nitronauta litoralis]
MNAYLTAVQLSSLLGIAKRTLLARSIEGSWPYELRDGNGGRTRYYKLTDLPISVQLQIKKAQSSGCDDPDAPGESLPAVAATKEPSQLELLHAAAGEALLPEWAEKKARARFDLLHQFHEHRDRAKPKGVKKKEADPQFIAMYKAGAWPQLKEELGEVSLKTIFAWMKILKDAGNDYRALAPKHGQHLKKKSLLTPEEEKELFLQLEHENRVPVSEAIRTTKAILLSKGIESPSSPATMRRAVNRYKQYAFDMWVHLREGEKAFIDKVLPYIVRDDSKLEVGDVLVGDGHYCNFFVTHPFTGKQVRPLLILFYDWRSRSMAGWAFSVTENTQVISAALRNSIIGLGKIPKVVYIDNGKAFRSKFFTDEVCPDFHQSGLGGLYQRLGIKCVFAQPYNARAKVVERFFRDFEKFERYIPTFCGSSIKDKPASLMRNEHLMKKLNKRAPLEISQVNRALQSWWSFEANRPHPTIKNATKAEVFEAGRGNGVDLNQLHFLMMDAQVKNLGRNGIRMLNGDYWNEALFGLRCKVTVRYDFNDISKIYVWDEEGEYLGIAERQKAMHPMAAHLGTAKDVAELKHKTKQIKSIKKQTQDLIKKAHDLTGRTANDMPWNNIIEIAPSTVNAVEKFEKQIEGEKIAAQIPQITSDEIDLLPEPAPEPEPENVRPLFETEVEHFCWLLEREEMNADDREFFEEYKKTEMGKTILQGQPERAKGGANV